MSGSLVTLRDVACNLGNGPVLRAVDLDIAAGTFTGIVGPSGSGKTTLLRTILGTVRPSAGTIERRDGLRVGYVPQVESIDWGFPVTVAEVLTMARPARPFRPWTDRTERAAIDAMLERLGLDGLRRRHIRALSGGQQQRVFLARALLGEPDLVLLDEPTSGVDVRTRHDLLHLLGDLHAEGRTIVLTTHDLNGVATHLPRLVALNTTVTAAGPPTNVLVPEVLEQTYGAPFEVLVHAGLRLVVDAPDQDLPDHDLTDPDLPRDDRRPGHHHTVDGGTAEPSPPRDPGEPSPHPHSVRPPRRGEDGR